MDFARPSEHNLAKFGVVGSNPIARSSSLNHLMQRGTVLFAGQLPCCAGDLRKPRHAYGAAFDNPDLIVACVVGDGEAETGPLATSWHSNKFLDPVTDGVVLPILHLNGYKIANPCILGRANRISGRWVRSNGNRPVANALALQ
jgi:hypothetical protein